MSNIKFSQLPNLGNITANTIVPVVSANTNYTVTAANLQSYVNSSTGNVTSGNLNSPTLNNSGNISVVASGNTWLFGSTGNLVLPRGGIVYETNIPDGALTGNTIALKPSGGTNNDQQLLVYPTATGADFNHLHLTSGNLYNTELFLGNDNLYVKLANTGNIVINSNDDAGNSSQWTFGTAGTILNSGNLTLQTPNGVPGAVTAITGSSGSWESNPRNNLATAGGSGTGLRVNVTETGGYASTIAIATAGTGYSNGDSISVVSGSSDASFTISVLANGWTFGTNGNLTLPSNTFAVNYANGTAVSLGGTYGNANVVANLAALGSNPVSTTGNVTGGNLLTGGLISATGNVTGNYILGNGSQLTGLPATYGNSNVVSLLSAFGSNTVSTTGNITAGNLIGNISITGNVQGTSPNVTLVAGSYSYTFDNAGTMTLPAGPTGDEGGEIAFTQAANSTLAGNTVVLDQYVDRIRFFEGGGNARGVYIDMTQAADGVNTLLNNRVSGIVNAGVFVTMDNLKATVTTSSNRGLSLATVSGTVAGYVSSSYSLVTGSPGGAAGSISLTTTPSSSIQGYNFTSEGDTAIYVVRDNTNNRVYRVTMMIGGAYNNNMISIERLL